MEPEFIASQDIVAIGRNNVRRRFVIKIGKPKHFLDDDGRDVWQCHLQIEGLLIYGRYPIDKPVYEISPIRALAFALRSARLLLEEQCHGSKILLARPDQSTEELDIEDQISLDDFFHTDNAG